MGRPGPRTHILLDDGIVAYSPRAACKAFVPPMPDYLIRAALADGTLRSVLIGRRTYVTHDQLKQWAADNG
ncbi:hypothetical protein MTX26_01750 [Bradyrhizobium sp. ISRA443]|uniref:hypothetical protein n=1 Tax=unclassified Bradyrhizobium TaxID=2631580 RepID=UPI002478841B|nr:MULTISPECIES: hypothetical protein [unclassified Bradyrhizobium]WGR99623.1 hypothetical protein MTX23_01750 [Bradyrhizobium sp. ISRA436]WGS06513.1 hypothetical protein MTX18_01750 [Bradyrhizobium sp. ISRA437]WGS13397.1 hypothetical protein MTX26_01750 [Bradyrhizobium sp. ISRA443]